MSEGWKEGSKAWIEATKEVMERKPSHVEEVLTIQERHCLGLWLFRLGLRLHTVRVYPCLDSIKRDLASAVGVFVFLLLLKFDGSVKAACTFR